jgi:hypothetical protein
LGIQRLISKNGEGKLLLMRHRRNMAAIDYLQKLIHDYQERSGSPAERLLMSTDTARELEHTLPSTAVSISYMIQDQAFLGLRVEISNNLPLGQIIVLGPESRNFSGMSLPDVAWAYPELGYPPYTMRTSHMRTAEEQARIQTEAMHNQIEQRILGARAVDEQARLQNEAMRTAQTAIDAARQDRSMAQAYHFAQNYGPQPGLERGPLTMQMIEEMRRTLEQSMGVPEGLMKPKVEEKPVWVESLLAYRFKGHMYNDLTDIPGFAPAKPPEPKFVKGGFRSGVTEEDFEILRKLRE